MKSYLSNEKNWVSLELDEIFVQLKRVVKVESVEFHNCVAWGKAGELIAQYMKKGSHIMVQGKLKTSSWDDKETGKKMYKTEINIRDFQFGRKSAGQTTQTASTEAPKEEVAGATELMDDEINSEDIPF